MAEKKTYLCPFRSFTPQERGYSMQTILKCPAKHDDALFECPLHMHIEGEEKIPGRCAFTVIAVSITK